MKKILHIISSPRDAVSNSTQLGNQVIAKLQERYPGSSVAVNNVVENDYSHITAMHVAGYFLPAEDKTQAHIEVVRPSDAAVQELMDADLIVVSLPLYNFNMPSALKAWIDHIVRSGITFSYKTGQPEGLLKNKKVYLAIASNGVYSEGPMKAFDFSEPYLKFIFSFIGLNDITTFRIEGTGIPGFKETAVQKGLDSVAV